MALIEGQNNVYVNQVNIPTNNGYIPPQQVNNDYLRGNQVNPQPIINNFNPPMTNTPNNNMNVQGYNSLNPNLNNQIPPQNQEYNINNYNVNLPNFYTLYDPNDLSFAQISQNAIVNDATLPSGFKVPSSRDGKNWRISGNTVILI